MLTQFSRTEILYGHEAMEKLAHSRVMIFGIGGVGGYVVEALARSGIGALDLVDNDVICLTNLNRQIIATHSTLGRYKVEVAQERIHAISPETVVRAYPCFYLPDTADQFNFKQVDYVVDAIDTVKGKLTIITRALADHVPIISSMGTGNKIDPSRFRVADIHDTRVCPLARIMRTELRRLGVPALKVVYSDEPPIRPMAQEVSPCQNPSEREPGEAPIHTVRRDTPGSTAFVPATAGLLIASEVVKDLTAFDPQRRRTGR